MLRVFVPSKPGLPTRCGGLEIDAATASNLRRLILKPKSVSNTAAVCAVFWKDILC